MDLEKELAGTPAEDKEEKPPRYIIRDAAYALQPQKPIEYIIDKLIGEGSVSLFYGEPGSKKTYTLLSLAVCVALGKPWLGFLVKARKVLIIDEESGERRLTMRLAAAIRGELGDENAQIEFVSLAQFKLDDKEDIKELEQLIEDRQAGLVIVDALTDVMDGDENSKMDVQPVFSRVRGIAERTQAAIIIIHHSNRSGGYRGSSAIKGSLDLMVKIISEDKSKWIEFRSEKTRDIDAVHFSAVANWTEDQFYLELAESQGISKKMSKSKAYVIRYLKEHGPSPLPDIQGAADICSSQSARQALYSLVEDGALFRTNPDDKGQGVVAVYALAKDGDQDEE